MMVRFARNPFVVSLYLSMVLLAVGCGDSSSDPSPESSQRAVLPVHCVGSITGFGSILIEGTAYDLMDQTEVLVDGRPGSQADLRKGMQVVIRGRISRDGTSGEADRVSFENDLEGPVSSIDPANQSLDVLGRTVVIDAGTIIKDYHASRFTDADDHLSPRLSLQDLQANDLIEVSGLEAAGGSLLALRIERKADTFDPGITPVEVKGTVSQFDDMAMIFQMGDLIVDLVNVYPLTQGALADGTQVDVKGTLNSSHDTLEATEVAIEDSVLAGIQEEKIFLQGVVNSITSAETFMMDGITVDASEAAFENGLNEDLVLQVALTVEGFLSGNALKAEKIKFRGTRIQITAPLMATPGTHSLKLLGLDITFNGLTEIRDMNGGIGKDTSVEASLLEGELVATKIVYTDSVQAGSDVSLRGPAFIAPRYPPAWFYILGITVLSAQAGFEDVAGQSISEIEFYNQVNPGAIVVVQGGFDGFDTIVAAHLTLMQ